MAEGRLASLFLARFSRNIFIKRTAAHITVVQKMKVRMPLSSGTWLVIFAYFFLAEESLNLDAEASIEARSFAKLDGFFASDAAAL